ncbi:MAG: HAMP domain-containing histidine kinase [Chloroflexi bacterium]|nr:HAMP domain-containing histidine kinase [Chloroflexota bacterium]
MLFDSGFANAMGEEARGGRNMDSEASVSEELARANRETMELREELKDRNERVEAPGTSSERPSWGSCSHLVEGLRRDSGLRDIDQLKSEFLALISHELRTPLTAILGFTDLMLKGVGGPLTPKQEHYVKTVLGSAEELLGAINCLIEFSALEAGQNCAQLARVSISETTAFVVDRLSAMAMNKGVKLENKLQSSQLFAKGDEPRLRRALDCIVSNAIKFTPAGGEITIEARAVGGRVVIRVDDTGIGMLPEDLEQVWESFRQADSSPARKFGGLGLGLSIAKKLVEIQGGSIRAESRGPEQGSAFAIELPQWVD